MKALLFLCCCIATTTLVAQTKVDPVIKSGGGVFDVQFDAEKPDSTMEYKIVATISDRDDNKSQVDPRLDHFARMYNLHIYGGIPQEKLNVVLIIFAGATPIALNNETYHTKFNVDNPNLVLLDGLQKAGVKILACAQSMALHKINPTSLTSRVAPALSRFTALSTYQLKGYATFIL